MKKVLLLVTLSLQLFALPIPVDNTNAKAFNKVRVNFSPIEATVNQQIGSSLELGNYSGSSITLSSVNPIQVWSTQSGGGGGSLGPGQGSSNVSFAMQSINLGGGTPTIGPIGNQLAGSSVYIPWGMTFFQPSYTPYYGNSLQVLYGPGSPGGGSTFSVRMLFNFSDGSSVISDTKTLLIDPISLPSSQQSGAVR